MIHRVAVVGLGGIAQKGHLPVLISLKDVELLFYSRDKEKVDNLAKEYHVSKATNNLEQLLEWKPDSAFVLTPTPTHAEKVAFFLNAGVDVLVEKPATINSEETHRLAKLADEKKRILMVSFNRRYAPLSIQMKELWSQRKVMLGNFQKSRTKPNFKGLATHISEELVHVIDLVRFLCGEAIALKTVCNLGPEELVLDIVTLLQFESGGYATITAALQAGHWFEHYELNGENTTMKLNCFYDLQMITNGQIQTWKEPYDSTWNSNLYGRGFVSQIEHFFHCIETRHQPQTNAWDCVKTQQLLEDIISKNEIR